MKSPMNPADLWVLLDSEFRRRQPRACATCFVPLPFRVDARDGAANWEVDIPQGCGECCELLLEELVLELQGAHDLSTD